MYNEYFLESSFNSAIYNFVSSCKEEFNSLKKSISILKTPFGTLFKNPLDFICNVAIYIFSTEEKYKYAILSSKQNYLSFEYDETVSLSEKIITEILKETDLIEEIKRKVPQFYELFLRILDEVPSILQVELFNYMLNFKNKEYKGQKKLDNLNEYFLHWDILMRNIIYNYNHNNTSSSQEIVKMSLFYTGIITNIHVMDVKRNAEFSKNVFLPLLHSKNIPEEICNNIAIYIYGGC